MASDPTDLSAAEKAEVDQWHADRLTNVRKLIAGARDDARDESHGPAVDAAIMSEAFKTATALPHWHVIADLLAVLIIEIARGNDVR